MLSEVETGKKSDVLSRIAGILEHSNFLLGIVARSAKHEQAVENGEASDYSDSESETDDEEPTGDGYGDDARCEDESGDNSSEDSRQAVQDEAKRGEETSDDEDDDGQLRLPEFDALVHGVRSCLNLET